MDISELLLYPEDNARRIKAEEGTYTLTDEWWEDDEDEFTSQHANSFPPTPTTPPTAPAPPPTTVAPASTITQPDNQHHQQPPHDHRTPLGGTFQTLRLRDDQPIIVAQPTASSSTAPQRPQKKRKTPPTTSAPPANPQDQHPPPPQPPQPPPGMQHLPGPPPPGVMPPHALMHPGPPALPPHLGGPPPPIHAYQYVPAGDYTPGGMPPPPPPGIAPPVQGQGGSPEPNSQSAGAAGRSLSQSKRAEQNRKAQRAFRERRDQHVKALESRSQLLDAALASADEANRRWEDCRALVDQLRIENAALRAALNQLQQQQATTGVTVPLPVSIAGIGQGPPANPQPPGVNGTAVPTSDGPSADDKNADSRVGQANQPPEDGEPTNGTHAS